MLPATRQQKILGYIQEKGSAQVKELADYCHVSEATVRRDLDEMAQAGSIERTHGGAMIQSSTTFERVHREKMELMLPEKKRIAKMAASLVSDGESIFVDSGTTAFFLAQQLTAKKDLTVVTNNLDIACSVPLDGSSTMVITGGMRRENYNVLVGSTTEEFISGLYVDIAFLGCDAINSQSGVFNSNFLEIGVKKQITRIGKRLVLLTDHTKFRRNALAKVCNLRDIDVMISDKGLDGAIVREVEEAGPKVILV